jgi:hypothetical protein
MVSFALVFSRDYDLPRAIVWDAFVDEDLIDGWLPPGSMAGDVTALEPRERLVIESAGGILDFRLTEIPTGARGTGTTVTVSVTGEGDDPAGVTSTWHRNLDQLEGLLRGHPTDWRSAPGAGEAAAPDSNVHGSNEHNAADGT